MTSIWEPQAGPQTAAIHCDAYDLLFGGARGGGKTDYIVGDWAIHWNEYRENAHGVIIRKNYPQLQEIMKRTHQIYPKLGAEYQEAGEKKKWIFPGGGELYFRHFDNESSFENMQGWNLSRIYVDEMGQFADPLPLDKLKACLRSRAGVKVGFRGTANPGGPGHHWIKKRYIDPAPGGYTLMRVGGGSRIFIPSKITDNKILLENDPNYVDRLKDIGSPELVRAWVEGDWNVIQGAYFPEFTFSKHIVRPHKIPNHWMKFMAMDWGSSSPFSVLWCAVSDGVDYKYPKNSIVVYREWYGGKDGVGLKMTAEEVAEGIKQRMNVGECMYGVIDPSAFKVDGGPSIAERMGNKGVYFRRADNARLAGWDQVRFRLKGEENTPLLYFFDTCTEIIRTLPSMQHDTKNIEDLDTDGDDHAVDALRYACMSRPWTIKQEKKIEYKCWQEMSFEQLFPLTSKPKIKRAMRV